MRVYEVNNPSRDEKDVTECDAAIVGSGITGLATAYHIKQPRPDERAPVIGRKGNTAKYAHSEKLII